MLPTNQLPIDIKGLDDETRAVLVERIEEFEKDYEKSSSEGGPGYVEKIKKSDYAIAIIFNAIIAIYYVVAVLL